MTENLTLLHFPEDAQIAARLASLLKARIAPINRHVFPDEEVLLSLPENVDEQCAIICVLDRPNSKYLQLVFAAAVARERGAQRLGLIAPYLPYMRQDTHFLPGDVVSARLFANEISQHFDWLVTVDPHLHRIGDLAEVFNIPCAKASAAPAFAQWILEHLSSPLIIGPDRESAQWIKEIASLCGASYIALSKERQGDAQVSISNSGLPQKGKMPVLIDDIASTAETMAKAVALVRGELNIRPYCLCVHAVFAPGAFERLIASGPMDILTANTIPHRSNRIDITAEIAAAVQALTNRTG
ncbi:MAG TPA: ribose-phosphate diphosphokinase [Rhizomicrobium sp.]|nr:ribose-phosphate diphosphokinase [Rhizomicrobium sp.]